MDWNSSNRRGRVFFDYNQNSKGKTLASIFSVMPTLSATVSMPIEGRELSNVRPAYFSAKRARDSIKGPECVE